MLVLSRKPNEAIIINGDIKVIVLGAQGQQIRLGFEAPSYIEIYREEIFEKVQQAKINGDISDEEG